MFSLAKSPASAEAGASRDELAGMESQFAAAGPKLADAEDGTAQLTGERHSSIEAFGLSLALLPVAAAMLVAAASSPRAPEDVGMPDAIFTF